MKEIPASNSIQTNLSDSMFILNMFVNINNTFRITLKFLIVEVNILSNIVFFSIISFKI